MNCEQARPLVDAYVDDELNAADRAAVEEHLRACNNCSQAWQNLQSVKKAVRQQSMQFPATPELRRRLRVQLRIQDSLQTRSFWDWNWLTTLATGLATVCLVGWLTFYLSHPSAQEELARQVVASHIRSLMADHRLDVASTDQHTVKPWFAGKLDFSPPVKDFADKEYPLIGGRLDYLDDRTVAALVFQRHKHVINLFVWPVAGGDSKPGSFPPIQGYNMVHWARAGMAFWAVSDLNEKELEDFAGLYGQ
jgi:anti-sigma factor (TIGR02949 family)